MIKTCILPFTVLLQPHLCMFEGVHDEDGEAQSEDVSQEAGVEIRPAVFLQAVARAGLG